MNNTEHTKRLFGFRYTEGELERMRGMCQLASEYMKKKCSYGLQDTSRIVRKSY